MQSPPELSEEKMLPVRTVQQIKDTPIFTSSNNKLRQNGSPRMFGNLQTSKEQANKGTRQFTLKEVLKNPQVSGLRNTTRAMPASGYDRNKELGPVSNFNHSNANYAQQSYVSPAQQFAAMPRRHLSPRIR